MAGWWRVLAAIMIACGVMIAAPLAARPALDQSLPVVALTAGEDAPALASAIRYTKDIGPVAVPITRLLDLPLRTNAGGAEHFGAPGQRTVLALHLRNTSEQAGTWILTTGRGSLSHFRLYTLKDETFALILDGTDPAAAQANLRAYQAFSSELTLDPGKAGSSWSISCRTIRPTCRSSSKPFPPSSRNGAPISRWLQAWCWE
ncbi:MAG: hypothetical protein ACJLS3_11670 [Erythrobacter sp.]